MRPVHAEREPGGAARGGQAALAEVVAVQRAGQHPGLARALQVGLQPLGEPDAAGPDADQCRVRPQQVADAAAQLGVERFGVQGKGAHANSPLQQEGMVPA